MKMMKFFGTAAALFVGVGAALAADSSDPFFHLTFDEDKDGAMVCVDRMNPERVCKMLNPKRTTFAPGKVGKALVLDNPTTKNAPKEDPMAGIEVRPFWDDDFTKSMSIEVWVKMAKDINYRNQLMYIAQCGYQSGFGFSLFYNGGNFVFLTGPSDKQEDAIYTFAPVADLRDEWVHLAATYDGEKKLAHFYINGECVKDKENFVITPPHYRGRPFYIGCMGNQRGWRGAIDELKIYKRVLTPAEILQHAKLDF